MDTKKIAEDNKIMECYSGSHAYGTSTPESDVDYRGLFVAPRIYTTPFHTIEQYTAPKPEDRVLYEVSKFLKLVSDQNPNVIEFLWVDDDSILFRNEIYDYLRSQREKLLSSQAKFRFAGYAFSQLERIKGHNKWINNPQPKEPPRQTDFVKLVHNFSDDKILKIDIYDYRDDYRLIPFEGNLFGLYVMKDYQTFNDDYTLNSVYDPDEDAFVNDDGTRRHPLFVVKFCKEEYLHAKRKHKDYWTWKKERNPIRAALEEKYGYDCKHAMHLVRLMRMCKEILTEGVVHVKRPDAEELLAIRNGSLTYEQVLQLAAQYDNEMNDLYKKTALQRSVNPTVAGEILMTVQDMMWSK